MMTWILLCVLWLVATPATAALYWDDTFDTYADQTAFLATWGPSSCSTAVTSNNVGLSTQRAHTGTKSIKITFYGDPSVSSCFIDGRAHLQTPTLYARWWMYLDNFTSAVNSSKTKITLHPTYGYGPANVSIWWEFGEGTTFLVAEVQGILLYCGQLTDPGPSCPNPKPTLDTQRVDSSGTSVPSGQWVCVETRLSYATPGVDNGIVEAWINGTQVLNKTNQRMDAATQTQSRFQRVRLYNQNGQGAFFIDDYATGDTRIGCGSAPSDTTPPTQVTGLIASPGNTQVQLSSFSASDDSGTIGVYNIERSTSASGPFTLIAQTGGGPNGQVASFLSTGLTNGTTYYFRVAAQDPNGNIGPYSSTVSATPTAPAAGTTVVGRNSQGKFTINGAATHLVGISYFDTRNWRTSDIDAIDAAGYNLIRIFLDWYNDSIFDTNGAISGANQTTVNALIDYCAARGIVVDMTILFAGNSNAPMSAANRLNAITNAFTAFGSKSNLIWDLMNEHNDQTEGLQSTHGTTARQQVQTARAACPTCLISYSNGNLGSPVTHFWTPNEGTTLVPSEVLAELADGVDFLAPHTARPTDGDLLSTAWWCGLRNFLDANGFAHIPIYDQEPFREPGVVGASGFAPGSAARYFQYFQAGKTCGVAAQVFHTSASFELASLSMIAQFHSVETQTFNGLPAALASTSTTERSALITEPFTYSNGTLPSPWQGGYTSPTNHTTFNVASNKIQCSSLVTECLMTYSTDAGLALLDDFNRANEGPPPSASWTNAGGNSLKVISNVAGTDNAAVGADNNATWTAALTGNVAIQADMTVEPASGVIEYGMLHLAQANNSTANSYRVEIERWVTGGGVRRVKLVKYVAGVDTTLGSPYNPSASTGTWKLERNDGVITVYHDGVARISANDSTFTGTSYGGIATYYNDGGAGNVVRWDNFRGATLAATSTALPANHYAKVDIASWVGSGDKYVRLLVRYQAPANQSGYECQIHRQSGVDTAQIKRRDAGSPVILATATIASPGTGTYYCDAVGSTITAYKGTTALVSATDTTYTTGLTGLYAWNGDNVANIELDNFEAGEFVPVAITTPIITTLDTTASGLTYTYTGSLESIRVATDIGSTVYTLAQTPGGVLNRVWLPSETFVCVYARDANGNENQVASEYQCDALVPADTTPPVITNGQPSGTLVSGTTSVTITAQTNEPSFCRIGATAGTLYANMTPMDTAEGTNHSFVLATVNGVTYTRYIRCQDQLLNTNTTDYPVTFAIDDPPVPPGDTTPPIRSNGSPIGILAAGTSAIPLTLVTDEAATCKYGTIAGTAYASIASTFTTTGGTSHSVSVATANNTMYTYYIRCLDGSGNANTTDYIITFSVAATVDATAPVISNGLPTGTLNQGTTATTLSWNTDEPATCRVGLSDTTYDSLTNLASTPSPQAFTYAATGLSAGTLTYYIRCRDTVGNTNSSSTLITFTIDAGAPADTTVPSTITGLVGANTGSSVSLGFTWNTPTDNVAVASVRLYLCEDTSCVTKAIALSILGAATSATVTGLSAGLVYTACVAAVDTSNNEGTCSASASATTTPAPSGDVDAPSQVTGFTTTSSGVLYNSISLTWGLGTDVGSGIVRTQIERCKGADCTAFRILQTVPYPTTATSDTHVKANQVYRYRAAFVDRAGNVGAYSDVLTVTTAPLPRSIKNGVCGCE